MTNVTLRPEDSKPGWYEVYQTSDGKKLIVLEGLSVEDQPESYAIQQFVHAHYESFYVGYWLLLVATFSYLIGTSIVYPLYRRRLPVSSVSVR